MVKRPDLGINRKSRWDSDSFCGENLGRDESFEKPNSNSEADFCREKKILRCEHLGKLNAKAPSATLKDTPASRVAACRCVDIYQKLNKIAEGSYGVVYRALDKTTGDIVALKKLKLRNPENGFPITLLREIRTLKLARHKNIISLKEIVTTENMKSIFIVMEFYEHDLRSLMQTMQVPFLQSEIKTLMLHLLSAVSWLHYNWIIHRDIKATNLLLNNRGQLKLADFGLARRFGSPLAEMTNLVVTLWYRPPEILLQAEIYDTAIDMWSIGCVFGELINKDPLIKGKSELDQIKKIFQLLGTPTESTWPSVTSLKAFKTFNFFVHTPTTLRRKLPYVTKTCLDLISSLLELDPAKRISAKEALEHPYFAEAPPPKDPALFPSFPSKYSKSTNQKDECKESDDVGLFMLEGEDNGASGFSLKV